MKKLPIAFGTNGIRGNADVYPFTDVALYEIGVAIATWACKKYGRPKMLIGRDPRISGPRIQRALINGLHTRPVTIVDAGVIPTPGICQLIGAHPGYDCGIMISASHNKFADNGIKIFDAKRGVLSEQDEQEIVDLYYELESQVGNTGKHDAFAVIEWATAAQKYQEAIAQFFPQNFLKNKKIVLDCAHGATAHIAPELFRRFGAQVIALGVSPDGTNINDNCGSQHTQNLQKEVLAQSADAGFAFDGDGDRIVAVDKYGQLKEGDDIVALLLQLPEYDDTQTVVGTVMTNFGFELALKNQGRSLIRTDVGDKYVAAALEERQLPIGGELSGHVIVRDYLNSSDGLFVALKVLEAMSARLNWDMQTFIKVPQVLISVPVSCKKDLLSEPYASLIAAHEKLLKNGRILVRYSGTENVLRVMTEDIESESARLVAQGLAQKLQDVLK
ncbi:MAG: phosphoglucosamine mutase [bacterium]